MESTDVMVYEQRPLAATDLKAQVNLIQEVMRAVMKDGEHYGKIPGCGDKPSLLQPGAQKLIMTFRLVPDAEVEVIDLQHPTIFGHREYRVKVRMSAQNGVFLGSGVGSCNTMEKKYRFRPGPSELTETPVPKEYWDLRKEDGAKAMELIGGKGHTPKKNDAGQWVIAIQGEPIEHDNPADYYNTCEKMAFKRALVSATLTVTAASDIFTQDVEEMVEAGLITPKPETSKAPIQQPKAKEQAAPSSDNKIISGVDSVTMSNFKKKDGSTGTKYKINAGEQYETFSETYATEAKRAHESGLMVEIEFTTDQYGRKIKAMKVLEPEAA